MKIKALAALMLALPYAVVAKNVGTTEAQAIAARFFSESGMKGKPCLSQAPRTLSVQTVSVPAYHVFNSSEPGAGFVIVAGDDRMGSVLGYSDHGVFSLDGAPDGLVALMRMYEVYAAALSVDAVETEAVTNTGTPVVEPLMPGIHWGQDTPFNAMCPTYITSSGTRHYYVGCVATAATQIMRYYGYPTKGTGQKSYTNGKNELSADFGNTVYDWDNMPGTPADKPSAAQTAAYSTLCYHFGVAVEMQYEENGSAAYDHLVAPAFRNYFGYDNSARMYKREYYTTSEWTYMIKSELDAGRPVFYGATSDSGSGGHAFVLDGYDSNGYFHVNWGWYGRSDGYFMLNRLNPSELGEGGGSGGYNVDQDMITGIRPATSDVGKSYSAIYGATRLRPSYFGSDFLMMSNLENLDTDAFTGRIATVITDSDDNIVKELLSEDITVPGFSNGRPGGMLYTMRNVPANVGGLADGNYRVRFAYRATDCTEWHLLRHEVGRCNYMEISVSGGAITHTSEQVPVPDVKLLSAIGAPHEIYAGCRTRFVFNIDNRSENYRLSKIAVRLTSVDNEDNYYQVQSEHAVYEQSKAEFELPAELPADVVPGEYVLTACDPDFPDRVFDDSEVGTTSVRVLPVPDGPVVRLTAPVLWSNRTDGAMEIAQGEQLIVAASLRNDGRPGTGNVLVRLRNKSDGKSTVFLQQALTFAEGQILYQPFMRYLPQDPGTYMIELYQVDDDGKETQIENYGDEAIEMTVDPSEVLDAEVTDFVFSDRMVSGSKCDYSLSMRGNRSGSTAVRMRIRKFTAREGALIDMFDMRLTAGEETTRTGTYRCSGLADGRYMIMLENSSQVPYGGHSVYYKEVQIGATTGIEDISGQESAVCAYIDGDMLVVPVPVGIEVDRVDVFALNGARVMSAEKNITSLSVASLQPALYILRVVYSTGRIGSCLISVR